MNEENTATIEMGLISIIKDGEQYEQYCPYQNKRCSLQCPKCYIIDKIKYEIENFKPIPKIISKTLITCDVKYQLK